MDTFDHWKVVYEQQIQKGEAAPRLRRTHLALLPEDPIETILAYEPDKNSCDKDVQEHGYANYGSRTSLFIWNEVNKEIEIHLSWVAFGAPQELMLYQGKPLLLYPYWGGGTHPRLTGGIDIYHFVSSGFAKQYGHVPLCSISFELPLTIIKRMTKPGRVGTSSVPTRN